MRKTTANMRPKRIGSLISRPSLHEMVVERLRDMVMSGELPPGGRIPEKQLCDALGVSRTPLREALKVLANEGLVRLLPNRGAVVTEVTVEEVEDLFQVMAKLERLAGKLLAARINDAGLAEIEELHAQMLEQHRQRQRSEYFILNQRIHNRLTELAGNMVLTDIQQSLSTKLRRARYVANLENARWDESAVEHSRMIEALVARDGERLADEMSEHILRTGATVVAALRKIMESEAELEAAEEG